MTSTSSPAACRAYLQGALHDGTRSTRHNTHRISQKGTDWLRRLQELLARLGCRSWIYQEGKTRDVYVLETTAAFLDVDYDPDWLSTDEERIAYVRGYFDAEGGVPRSSQARFYVQFSQKDQTELWKVRAILQRLGVDCGVIHNPSIVSDADYWRFFVRTRSHQAFIRIVGSWHPRKEPLLLARTHQGHPC